MKSVTVRLTDLEHAAIEACMQKTRHKTISRVLRVALADFFRSLSVDPVEAHKTKQAREWQARQTARPSRL